MLRLALMLHLVIGTTLMGVGVMAVLIMGFDTVNPIIAAAALGFLLAIPASWLVARQIMKISPKN